MKVERPIKKKIPNQATCKRTILRLVFDLYVSLDARQCCVKTTTTFAIRCEKTRRNYPNANDVETLEYKQNLYMYDL